MAKTRKRGIQAGVAAHGPRKSKRRGKKRHPRGQGKAAASRLAGAWCRKGGKCWGRSPLCGDSGRQVQWCHITGRPVTKIMHDPRNCISMCASCHGWYGKRPTAFAALVESYWPGRGAELLELEKGPKGYAYWVAWYTGRKDCFESWDGKV